MNKEKLKIECIGEIDLSKTNDYFYQMLLDSLLNLLKQQNREV